MADMLAETVLGWVQEDALPLALGHRPPPLLPSLREMPPSTPPDWQPGSSNRAVVISGMHRSGTSVLANLLQAMGISVGSRLMEATEFNAKGYFEDLDFQELHESIIDASHHGFLHRDLEGRHLQITAAHKDRAKGLADRRQDLSLWGWKDPRTSLFLDMWDEVLPGAVYVFIYRDPAQVVHSLRRREDPELMVNLPGASLLDPLLRKLGVDRFRTQRAVEMWTYYNRRIVQFARTNPERCLLINVANLMDSFAAMTRCMQEQWRLPVREIDPSQVFDQSLMQGRGPEDLRRVCAAKPEVGALFTELESLSISTS